MSNPTHGRHRAPAHHSAALALTMAIGRNSRPVAKGSAVVVVSAAMVASFGMSASAGPHTALRVSLPAAAPVPSRVVNAVDISSVTTAVAVRASAPDMAGLVAPTFGAIGISGIVKPKPKPKPKPVVRVAPAVTHTVARRAVHHTSSRSVHHSSRSTTRKAINPAPTGSSHSGILAIAARYAGIRYVYGGSTPSGFDCSGYTSYVFRQAGISLPRTAAAQQGATHRVSSPQPGDLVFFGSPAYHVGIYAGGGKMWDSPHTGSSVGLHTIYSGVSGYGRP